MWDNMPHDWNCLIIHMETVVKKHPLTQGFCAIGDRDRLQEAQDDRVVVRDDTSS
jgi:hypothetical protein